MPRNTITSRKRKKWRRNINTFYTHARHVPRINIFLLSSLPLYPLYHLIFLDFSPNILALVSSRLEKSNDVFPRPLEADFYVTEAARSSPRLPLFNADEQLVTGWKTSYRHIDKRAPRSATQFYERIRLYDRSRKRRCCKRREKPQTGHSSPLPLLLPPPSLRLSFHFRLNNRGSVALASQITLDCVAHDLSAA